MNIHISAGIGHGPTQLAAFDLAVLKAGVGNYNLLYLSSVLPPGSEVSVRSGSAHPTGDWGDRLYLVMSQMRTSQRNQEAWAGIGWIQDPKTKKGLLVEHEGYTEAEVRADITNTLTTMAANRDEEFGSIQMHVTGIKCEAVPVCALVVAVFESAEWESRKAAKKTLFSRRTRN